jgi:hypothetical protein
MANASLPPPAARAPQEKLPGATANHSLPCSRRLRYTPARLKPKRMTI